MNIIIVGGGNAAKEFIEIFSGDEEVKIVGVADINRNAVGMVCARRLGIMTTNNMETMISRHDVDVVLEVTGNMRVRQDIIKFMREEQDIISAGAAQMMFNLLTRQMRKRNLTIADEIVDLSEELVGAIGQVDSTANDIEIILKDNLMLALNAQIEAAHIGESGATFSVIAERLQELFTDIQKSLKNINNSSKQSHKLLNHLDDTERKLREMEMEKSTEEQGAEYPSYIPTETVGTRSRIT